MKNLLLVLIFVACKFFAMVNNETIPVKVGATFTISLLRSLVDEWVCTEHNKAMVKLINEYSVSKNKDAKEYYLIQEYTALEKGKTVLTFASKMGMDSPRSQFKSFQIIIE